MENPITNHHCQQNKENKMTTFKIMHVQIDINSKVKIYIGIFGVSKLCLNPIDLSMHYSLHFCLSVDNDFRTA